MKKYVLILSLCFLLFCVAPKKEPEKISAIYDRKDWPHWVDEDSDCLNTRAEILLQRSLKPVQKNKKGCAVKQGLWDDYYYNEQHVLASKVDIDHLVPLKEAHESGGAQWSREKKTRFANDPENLVITNKKYNRQKGPRRPDQWLPKDRKYACKYLKDWIKIKTKYALKVRPEERKSVEGCSLL